MNTKTETIDPVDKKMIIDALDMFIASCERRGNMADGIVKEAYKKQHDDAQILRLKVTQLL